MVIENKALIQIGRELNEIGGSLSCNFGEPLVPNRIRKQVDEIMKESARRNFVPESYDTLNYQGGSE